MSILKQAFKLLNNFDSIKPEEQRRRVKRLNQLLKSAPKKTKECVACPLGNRAASKAAFVYVDCH